MEGRKRTRAEAAAGAEEERAASEVGRMVDSSQADDRRLIRLVRERRLLYARNNMPVASYYTQVKNLWDDVAHNMGWSVADVRRKWSHIRNSYSRHLRNEMHGACTSKGRMVSRWYLADELDFLREHMATDIIDNKRALRKERDRRYRDRHQEKINQRRRENRQKRQNLQRNAGSDVCGLAIQGDACSKKVDKNALRRERNLRYRERHREEINQRRRASRQRKQEITEASNVHSIEIQIDPTHVQDEVPTASCSIVTPEFKQSCNRRSPRPRRHNTPCLEKTQLVSFTGTIERRPTPYSSYAPTMLELDMNEPAVESVDVKPFIGHSPWFPLAAPPHSPKMDHKPPSIQNEDSSSSTAFAPDENTSYFQFFRGIYNDYQELPARKQRLFKRKCLNLLHDLLDAEETSQLSMVNLNSYHQESVLNLSNSAHGSEDDKEQKPNVDDCYILPTSN